MTLTSVAADRDRLAGAASSAIAIVGRRSSPGRRSSTRASRGFKRRATRRCIDSPRRTRSRRSRPARPHGPAVGDRDGDDAAHGRRQADADPAADGPAAVEDRGDGRVRDGLGVPQRRDRRPRDRRRSSSSRSCPRCSATSTPTPPRSSPTRTGEVIVTDGRNHIELTTEPYDIIVTDPPPPIFSSGASVISSLEYYQAGHARLNPGGVMMQWVPYGASDRRVQGPRPDVQGGLPARHDAVRAGPLRAVHDGFGRADELRRGDDPRGARPARASSRTSRRRTTRRRRRSTAGSPRSTRSTWIVGRRGRRVHRLGPADHRRPSAARILPACGACSIRACRSGGTRAAPVADSLTRVPRPSYLTVTRSSRP